MAMVNNQLTRRPSYETLSIDTNEWMPYIRMPIAAVSNSAKTIAPIMPFSVSKKMLR